MDEFSLFSSPNSGRSLPDLQIGGGFERIRLWSWFECLSSYDLQIKVCFRFDFHFFWFLDRSSFLFFLSFNLLFSRKLLDDLIYFSVYFPGRFRCLCLDLRRRSERDDSRRYFPQIWRYRSRSGSASTDCRYCKLVSSDFDGDALWCWGS